MVKSREAHDILISGLDTRHMNLNIGSENINKFSHDSNPAETNKVDIGDLI